MTAVFVNGSEIPVARGNGRHVVVHVGSVGIPVKSEAGDFWMGAEASIPGRDRLRYSPLDERVTATHTPAGMIGIRARRTDRA